VKPGDQIVISTIREVVGHINCNRRPTADPHRFAEVNGVYGAAIYLTISMYEATFAGRPSTPEGKSTVVRESELIELLSEECSASAMDWLPIGPGDDAAEVAAGEDGRMVVTTDMVVQGVHFEPSTSPDRVARKAVARSLSDVAGMAAAPRCTVPAVKFGPDVPDEYARTLVTALARRARELEAPLAGGDICFGGGPLSITVTSLGIPGPAGSIRRSGARPGDRVCVTGELGGSIRGRHLTFRPRTAEVLELADMVELHALIDISDGLSTDALHVAEQSGVGLRIRAGDIPVSADADSLAADTGRTPLWHALNDGEDYELLFCVAPDDAARLQDTEVCGTPVRVIGEVTESASELVLEDGSRRSLEARGWEHESG
jgi:thiamine-monophosphate kinase